MAKVSILMPACNVEKFLRECMDSVVNQTLEDIEIICLDDGSKDSTGDILDEYAAKDKRIKVIHKPNSGYGHSMNVGLDTATGEYIGIIETDDFADLNMFEELYKIASRTDADVVKSNYYTYVSEPRPESTFFGLMDYLYLYNRIIKPSSHPDIFRMRPCIWSGIYKRQFLVDNNIRFTETPGASYQDTGFAFKVWASAGRACLVKDAYLHYRTDNANSSVKSAAKIYCICDEYASIEKYLDERPELNKKLAALMWSLKYESYRWNLERLTVEFKPEFLMRMHEEFKKADDEGLLKKFYYSDYTWYRMKHMIDDPKEFYYDIYLPEYEERQKEAAGYTKADGKKKNKTEASKEEADVFKSIEKLAKNEEKNGAGDKAGSSEHEDKVYDIKVSVVIAVYNAQEFLRECLDSIITQTLREIEIICVDDGSSDDSLQILEEYAKKDSRVVVIHQENSGAGAARNNGLSRAQGEYLSFLDADDFFDKDMLKAAYERAHEKRADVCVFNADLFDNSTKKYKKCTWAFRKQYFPVAEPFAATDDDAKDNIYRMFNGWPWDKLFRREFVQKEGLEYQNLRTTNDMFFVFMGLALAKRIVTVDRILAHQRVDVSSSLSRTREKSWDCFYTALRAMQDALKERGLYEMLEHAFVNWALNFSLWQLNTMDNEAFEKTYDLLKKEGFVQLDITRHDRSYFFSMDEYSKFLKIFTGRIEDYKK